MNQADDKDIDILSELHHELTKRIRIDKFEERFQNIKGLSTAEIGVISILSKNPDILMGEIGRILNVPKSTLTSVIDRLEKRGLITRIISKKDRRSFGLELTEKGKSAQKEHLEMEKLIYGKIVGALENKEERETFFRIVKKIIDSLDE